MGAVDPADHTVADEVGHDVRSVLLGEVLVEGGEGCLVGSASCFAGALKHVVGVFP